MPGERRARTMRPVFPKKTRKTGETGSETIDLSGAHTSTFSFPSQLDSRA